MIAGRHVVAFTLEKRGGRVWSKVFALSVRLYSGFFKAKGTLLLLVK